MTDSWLAVVTQLKVTSTQDLGQIWAIEFEVVTNRL
jgi:hypothetical protein